MPKSVGAHPEGIECDPAGWWRALPDAGRDLLPRAAAVGGDAQQHGMVVLDSAGAAIRPRAAFATGSH